MGFREIITVEASEELYRGELQRTVDGIEHARDYCVYSLGSSNYWCGEGSVVSCALWKTHCDASC